MSDFHHRFAERTAFHDPSTMAEMIRVNALPDMIPFMAGFVPPELFPYEALQAASAVAFSDGALATAAFQYGASEGYLPLRRLIAQSLVEEGVSTDAAEVLITTGSTQAIELLAKAYLDPGDEVVVGGPTYLGALQAFSGYQAKFLTVPVGEEGMDLEVLENVLRCHRPKLIYEVINFQNPTGVCMPRERQARLYELARAHRIPVIEDDPYGALYYGAHQPQPLKSLDSDGGVILLRTFSKIIAPGLRIGYAVAPPEVMAKLLPIKQNADINSSPYNQVMVHAILESGILPEHLAHVRRELKRRRDQMLAAMEAYFPSTCRWTRPEGGLFVWVTLPERLFADGLFKKAVEHNVAFLPGRVFFDGSGGANALRLSFSNTPAESIEEGIRRLGEVLHAACLETARL